MSSSSLLAAPSSSSGWAPSFGTGGRFPAPLVALPNNFAANGHQPTADELTPSFSRLVKGPMTDNCARFARRQQRRRRKKKATLSSGHFANFGGPYRLGQLYSHSGVFLQIYPNRVNGTKKDRQLFSVLEFLSVAFGLVSLRGKASQNYLCMAGNGRLYSSERHSIECVFEERMLENYYTTYSSCAHGRPRRRLRRRRRRRKQADQQQQQQQQRRKKRKKAANKRGHRSISRRHLRCRSPKARRLRWFVGLKRNGKWRRGCRAGRRHKAAQFLQLFINERAYRVRFLGERVKKSAPASGEHRRRRLDPARVRTETYLRAIGERWTAVGRPPPPAATTTTNETGPIDFLSALKRRRKRN